MGPILFGKACAAYTASVKPVCLLLDMTALLDELPRRTKANDWTCSGLGRSASTLVSFRIVLSASEFLSFGASDEMIPTGPAAAPGACR
jgi:hypothetical protein